jgi:hypothetical protein
MNEEPKYHDGFFSWLPSPLNGEGHQKLFIFPNVTLALEGRGLEPEANWRRAKHAHPGYRPQVGDLTWVVHVSKKRAGICPGSRVRVLLTGPFRTMRK